MTDDERFEQFVREAAADYEAPRGEVPRDVMWSAIRARREAAAPPRVVAPGAASVETPVAAMRRRPHLRLWMGMAATLLLGVAIGRLAWRNNAPAVVAVAPSATATPPEGPVAPTATEERAIGPDSRPAAAPVRRPMSSNGGARSDARANSYNVATLRHLENVEALFTSVAASSAEARTDSLVARWAKDLLSNTRLLLDSPAAADPMRARLLQDLEVILVQLVQRSPGGDAEARSTLERTLNKTQIIPRLRSAVPASLHSGTD